jgi:branched-chain amino acid transport system ATP-binding protein
MALLDIEDLHVYYGHIHALRGISLAVEEGEIVAMLGSNGAGKTTTLRTISGIQRGRQGHIRLAGERIDHRPPHEIVALGIGHSPEGRRVFGRLTVRENLEMGAFRRNDQAGIRDDMERVLTLFPRLRERISQIAGTLSGGEQQMLAIGRAMMTRPRILLLDEPSMGLAPVLVESIFQTIQSINAQGGTVLLVEQNAYMALSIARRAYVLQTGEIILQGPAAELRENPEVKKAYLGG